MLPGQLASIIGVGNQIKFSVTPIRNKNLKKYEIEKGKNFLKELYFYKILCYF
jgi:hypothetical protein